MALRTDGFTHSDPEAAARTVLASGPRDARLRMTRALAAWPGLTTHSGPSIRELLQGNAGVCQLVAYFDCVSADRLELLKELKRETPDLLIVAVCETADRRALRRLLDGGIDGFVFADQMVVPRDLGDAVEKPSLSARERQILAMVMMGLTNQEIGGRMYLAESTVKSHLSSAYTKLGVRSRSEAVAMILDQPDSLGTGIAAVAPKLELRAA
jgi:DNA-binding NarL/FixJ family response regulator